MATASAFPGYEEEYVASSAGYEHSEPLPSYDLEEINPSYALSSVPAAQERADYAALLTTDDPFAAVDAGAGEMDEPFAAEGDAPLPSFPLSEEGKVPREIQELDAGYDAMGELGSAGYGEPSQPGHADYDGYGQDFGYQELGTDEALDYAQRAAGEAPAAEQTGPPPLAGTRAFQGGDSLEDALEEAEFFASRGLFEDAMAIIEEQAQRFPNHPLLIERQREISEAMAGAGGSGELMLPGQEQGAELEPVEDNAFDIAASLDVLDGGILEPIEQTDNYGNKSVDVEEVFAKFKEGVKAQVSESDSQTHYDLGVAYKEMGLLNDAIAEFTMAARDPKRECICWSMIGLVRNDLGDSDGAIEAFIRGLHAEQKSMEQELALYFELGSVYQSRDNPQEALYYFEKVLRRDPNFRDVAQRVRALQPHTEPSRLKSAVGDDDFDRAFDDLFGDSKLSQG